MITTSLTKEALTDALLRLAQNSPDNIYPTTDESPPCSYTEGGCTDGSVGCIMGQALRLCGIPLEELQAIDAAGGKNIRDLMYLLAPTVAVTDREFLERLKIVQQCQDNGSTWKDAVAELAEQ